MMLRLVPFVFICCLCSEPTAQKITPSAGKPRAPVAIEAKLAAARHGKGEITVMATVSENIDRAVFELRGLGRQIQKTGLVPGKPVELVFTLPAIPAENLILDVELHTGTVRYKSSHEILTGEREEVKPAELKKGQRHIKEL